VAIEQLPAPVPESMVQLSPASVGRVSVITTPLATPGPALDTVIVKPMASPAETVATSATLVMPMLAASTVTLALAWRDPSLEVVTTAVLWTGESAGVAEVVGLVRCTCTEAPAARVPMVQVRTPEPIEQPGAVVPPASMDQEVPASVGRVSVRATPLATPGPAL